MNLKLAAALVASIVLSQASYAQDKSASDTSKPGTNQSSQVSSSQNLPQEIRNKQQNQGLTNEQVVPGSFLGSAKDKQGDPVTMILGPHSMPVVTVSSGSDNSQQTTGR